MASVATTSVALAAPVPTVTASLTKAKFVYPDGGTYEGEYIMTAGSVPRKHGAGSYVDQHCTYDGHWANDRMQGKGVYVGASGGRYEGEFMDDQFHGHGKYEWSDGSVYTGSWSNSKMHGKGEYVSHDGIRWVGEFFNGLFFNGKSHISVR